MTVLDLEAPADTVRRDRWGRYMVLPVGASKPEGWTRATSVGKALEDTANLTNWSNRMVALGLAQRADILADVQIADPTDRKTLNRLCEKAKDIGGANTRRDLGTAIHTMFERSIVEPGWTPPDTYAADIAAIHAELAAAGLEPVAEYSEVMVVLDRHKIAGTADLVVRRITDGALFIADLKTGSSVKYGALGWAVQLAIYAHADNIYRQGKAKDGSEDERLPMPPVSRDTAIIIHVEPGSGSCDLHQLDIARGAEALEVAMAVRQWRKERDLLVPFTSSSVEGGGTAPPAGAPSTDIPADDDHQTRVDWALRRVAALKSGGHAPKMGQHWPDDTPMPADVRTGNGEWTAGQLTAVLGCLDLVEGLVEAPFDEPDPIDAAARDKALALAVDKLNAEVVEVPELPEPDEADEWATDDEVLALRTILQTMLASDDADKAQRVIGWAKEGQRQHRPWNMAPAGQPTSKRRHAISAAALELVDLDDERVRALIATVIGDDVVQPVFTTGGLLGCLTAEQANELARLAAG